MERPDVGLELYIVSGRWQDHADAAHALLRPRPQRPSSRRSAEEPEDFAASHSITSSARPSNIGGTSSPIAFAALRLITSSNLVGCSTANSAGFAPLRILSMYTARRRYEALRLGP